VKIVIWLIPPPLRNAQQSDYLHNQMERTIRHRRIFSFYPLSGLCRC
jgi:hypothetical protein